MARMLQALKNLEAKEPRAKSNRASATPAAATPRLTPAAISPTPTSAPSTPPAAPRMIDVVDELNAVVGHELSGHSSSASLPAFVATPDFAFASYSSVGQLPAGASAPSMLVVVPPVEPAAPPMAAALPTPEAPAAPSVAAAKAPCELERQVKRTLNNPLRSQPLVELVDRLLRDMAQSESKVLACFGLGTSDQLHLPMLQAATVLAERRSKHVLLIDGDPSRRGLSDGLEFGRCAGLGELSAGAVDVSSVCQATATRQLSFMPAGQLQIGQDAATYESIKAAIEHLKADFDCILIDAGNAGNDFASTAFSSTGFASALARVSDAAYLVVELGAVETTTAQAALGRLRKAGARVLGCIAT